MCHARKLITALTTLLLASLVCVEGAGAQRRFSKGALPPPRFADPERGTVSHASAREMQQARLAEGTSVFRNAVDAPLRLSRDEPAAARGASFKELTERHGACRTDAKTDAENAARGSWKMPCKRGWVSISITLAPTSPPRVPALYTQSVMPPSEEMNKVKVCVGL